MANLKVGVVTHYYDKIGVAIVKLSGNLSIGEEIKISKNDQEFSQKVESMQIEHKNTSEAKKGQTIGLKVDQPALANSQVYKVS